jgi:transaldolase
VSAAIRRLTELGQSPWYDNLTRAHAQGGLDELLRIGIRGVTSNPTIFEKAMAAGDDYDDQIARLARAGTDTESIYWELVTADIDAAAERLARLHADSGGRDGYVSVEVDPRLARDTQGTIDQATALFTRLGRPNVMVKIPATAEGLPAITECIRRGLNINVTLIFSLDRYDEVMDAYMAGLEARLANDLPVGAIASVASFFVSRVDTEIDRRLPGDDPLRGRAAVANAKLAYQRFLTRTAGDRWQRLAEVGARVQRPLWASTSTKNPDYSPTLYVDTLVGPDTVNTLAQASVDALAETDPAAIRPDTILEGVDEARETMDALAQAGVDIDDVTATLEREGVASFATSFGDALETLAKKAESLSG